MLTHEQRQACLELLQPVLNGKEKDFFPGHVLIVALLAVEALENITDELHAIQGNLSDISFKGGG